MKSIKIVLIMFAVMLCFNFMQIDAFANPLAMRFFEFSVLPMLGQSILQQSNISMENKSNYVKLAAGQYVRDRYLSEIKPSMTVFEELTVELAYRRVDLLESNAIDAYIDAYIADKVEYMDLTLEQKRIAMMEARMFMEDTVIKPSEVFVLDGVKNIAQLFINFFTEQLIADGYLVQELPAQGTYQTWQNVPINTEFPLSQYPYQFIKTDYSSTYLYASATPMYKLSGDINGYWNLSSSTGIYGHWLDNSTGTWYIYGPWNYPSTEIYGLTGFQESNGNVYTDSGMTTVLYADTVNPKLIDNYLDDTSVVPIYDITSNPSYDPVGTEEQQIPFVVPVPGVDTPVGEISLSNPVEGSTDRTITNVIENNVSVDVHIDTSTMEEILRRIEENTRSSGGSVSQNVDATFKGLFDEKINITSLTSSFERLMLISTDKGAAPKIYINLHDLYAAGVSRIAPSVSNPFPNQDSVFVDFEYLEDIDFAGYSVIDYFRFIIGMGMIWTTVLYVYNKIIPKEVVS